MEPASQIAFNAIMRYLDLCSEEGLIAPNNAKTAFTVALEVHEEAQKYKIESEIKRRVQEAREIERDFMRK
jgi:hypothetical protein